MFKEFLPNLNEIQTLVVPDEITEPGRHALWMFLHNCWRDSPDDGAPAFRAALDEMDASEGECFGGWTWKVMGKGVYVGTLPKRLAKFFFKHGVKLPPEVLQTIGTLAADNRNGEATIYYDFTNDIDWRADEFGQSWHGSCLWGSGVVNTLDRDPRTFAARLWAKVDIPNALEQLEMWRGLNQAAELREHLTSLGLGDISRRSARPAWKVQNDEVYVGYGRCFVTADTPSEGVAAIWNAYGDKLDAYARWISLALGLTYKRISLHNSDPDDGDDHEYGIYLNTTRGFVVGPPESIDAVDYDGIVYLSYDTPERRRRRRCASCDYRYDEDGLIYCELTDEEYCALCYEELFFVCDECGRLEERECSTRIRLQPPRRYTLMVCEACAEQFEGETWQCDHCGDLVQGRPAHYHLLKHDIHYTHLCPGCKRGLQDSDARWARRGAESILRATFPTLAYVHTPGWDERTDDEQARVIWPVLFYNHLTREFRSAEQRRVEFNTGCRYLPPGFSVRLADDAV